MWYSAFFLRESSAINAFVLMDFYFWNLKYKKLSCTTYLLENQWPVLKPENATDILNTDHRLQVKRTRF